MWEMSQSKMISQIIEAVCTYYLPYITLQRFKGGNTYEKSCTMPGTEQALRYLPWWFLKSKNSEWVDWEIFRIG